MRYLNDKSRSRTTQGIFLALLCVVLVILGGTIQVAHGHQPGSVSHSDCSLCTTAHLVILASLPVAVLVLARQVAEVDALLQTVPPRTLFVFELFTRPPPVDPAFF